MVGELGVKAKIEQITQRTWNVPIFDYFDVTTKNKVTPLQGFDYKMDAYTTLKYNFDGVYNVMNNIAQTTNLIMQQHVDAPIQQGMKKTNNALNSGAELIQQIEDGSLSLIHI